MIKSLIAICSVLVALMVALTVLSVKNKAQTTTTETIYADTACAAWPNSTTGTYLLSRAPSPASSLAIFVNGLRWTEGVDFSLSGGTVTLLNGQAFNAASSQGGADVVTCTYSVFLIQ